MRESTERSFQAYGKPLETVTSIKYLGRVMTSGYDKWTVVVGKYRKDRKSWAWMTRIMGWEGEDPRVSRFYFKAVVQAVLLFGSEKWVLTPRMEQALVSFQHRVAQWITRRHANRWVHWGWEYPPLASDMEEAGFEEIGFYTKKRQNTVVKYTATQPIMDLCERFLGCQDLGFIGGGGRRRSLT